MRNLVKKTLTARIAGTSKLYIFNTLLYFLKVFPENNHTPPPTENIFAFQRGAEKILFVM